MNKGFSFDESGAKIIYLRSRGKRPGGAPHSGANRFVNPAVDATLLGNPDVKNPDIRCGVE
jgi:hypothetical protein